MNMRAQQLTRTKGSRVSSRGDLARRAIGYLAAAWISSRLALFRLRMRGDRAATVAEVVLITTVIQLAHNLLSH